MSFRSTNWDEFIAEIAKSKISTPKLFRTFTLVFSAAGRPKTIEECSENLLNQPAKMTGAHLGRIYKLFDSDYPDLKDKKGNVKRQVLTEYLQELYKNQKGSDSTSDRPHPPTNPQNIPTPDRTQELTTLGFVGRDHDLTNLANLSRQAKIVLIKAEHGIGKTWLAKEFFSRHPDQYEVVQINFSLLLSEAAKAEEKLPIILKQLNQQTSGSFELNLDCLRVRLLDRSQKTVAFLINNLENYLDGEHKFPEELCNYESLLRLLGDRDINSFTLITSTREPSIQGVEISQYELRGLEIDEWRNYFSGCENAENSEVLIEMRNAYGGNAEAMRILRFTITSRFNKNIEDYWQLHRNTLLANHSLRNLIYIEISWLEANNSDAYKLFCRMGFYRYQDIQTVKFEGLLCLLWEVPESKRVNVVDYLSRTSLVNVFQGKYYLHPSVQEAARLCLPSDTETYRKVHQNIAQYWKSTISGESFFGNYINIFEAFYHYYTAENYQEAFQVFSEKINTDIYEKERYAYLRYWGYSQNVASCLEQLQANIADEHKAQLTGTIGVCYYYNNSFKKAIDFLEKAEKLISSGQDYRGSISVRQ